MAFHSMKTRSQSRKIMADKEEDRISDLPDDVLSHILSFLELREAVKTTILSKRWEKVWTSIQRVHLNYESRLHDFDKEDWRKRIHLNYESRLHDFDDEDWPDEYSLKETEEQRRRSFNKFVNRVLTGNSKLSVTSFSLSYALGSDLSREIQYLTEWIAAVVTPKLREFDFLITDGSKDLSANLLPPTLFECQKLEILKLNCIDSTIDICLEVPQKVLFPRLAKLHLVGVQLENENSLKNLLSGCPVLEELIIKEIEFLDKYKRNRNLFVFSPSLKILRVEMYHEVYSPEFGSCYVIEAPKLEYLNFEDYSLLSFSMSSSPSLVSAAIDISTIKSNASPLSLLELFRGISNVQKLELFTSDISMFEDELANLPMFHNLIHLKMGYCSSNIHFLNCILQISPNLKHLVFDEDFFFCESFISESIIWSQPNSVPKCLELHLETIEISVRTNAKSAKKIIEYLLDKGKVLNKMSITTSFEDKDYILMGVPWASVGCQIAFYIFPDDIIL